MAANAGHTPTFTFVDRVPTISVPRGVTIPPYGGNAVWTTTVPAYAGLLPLSDRRLDELTTRAGQGSSRAWRLTSL